MPTKIQTSQEYDDSLNDFVERVRAAFDKQFRQVSSDYETFVYCYATDVFDTYVIAREGDKYYRVTMEVTEGAITFAAKEDWEEVYLSYVTETLSAGRVRDRMVIYEIKGKYPDVAFAEGVDIKELTAGDDDPVFVTLPIGKANVLSGNSRFYDDKFVSELAKQVIEKRPIGLFGHLSKEERATAFPAEAVHWVGAQLVGELLWGKGYVPAGEARDRLKRYKATGAKIATSIDAWIDGEWDATLKAYRMDSTTLELNQIDIAPADRAGIGDLATVPHLTKEMGEGRQRQTKDNTDMERIEVIRSMTTDEARLLPKEVRDAIGALAKSGTEEQIRELRQALGADETADLPKLITELRQKEQARQAEAVKNRITELASDPEKGIKLATVRALVVELVTAKAPKTPEEAEKVYETVIATDAVKNALSGRVVEVMGPRQGTPIQAQAGASRYFRLPKEEAA